MDNLIARVKAAIVKNKTRRDLFTEIGSPPEFIVTRWGMWIASAEYYAENICRGNHDKFSANGTLVQKAMEAMNNETVSKFSEDQEGLPFAHNYYQENGKLKVQHSRGTVTSTSLISRKIVQASCLTLPRE